MVVCIAEKPSVAREIARILGANHPNKGFIEGNGYQVTWTFGHLCELKAPDEYTDAWKRWTLEALPMIPPRFAISLKEQDSIKQQFDIIKTIMSKADEIINCGDAGQEGELIQRWVMQKAGVKCPVRRLWISSMTDEAIREGFEKLRPQSDFQNLYMAGLSRAIGDWLLGMNCTRLYTLKYRNGYNSQVLSIGRVQTPTLALIVKRQEEIDNFKPEPYWILSTIYRDTTFLSTKGKFMVKNDGESALENVKSSLFSIKSVTSKDGTEAPPKLYDLTSLQVDCNKKFGYSAEMTLNLIQSLYEKKYTTYPRVDTTFLSDDVYSKCGEILQGIRGYEQFTSPLYGTSLIKRKKVFDTSKVTDHHAIIPTGQPAQNMTDMERNVYDLVTKAFIAVFYPDCKYKSTVVLGDAGGVEFKATGKVIINEGWRALYPKTTVSQETEHSKKDNEQNDQNLPDFIVGECGPHSPQLMEKQTQPPPYYSEATLLRAMETAGKTVDDEELRDVMKENGIGRPSTRAAIIETLYKRHYIQKQKKRIVPTITGKELISVINEELLKSAELTGIWEKKLRDIERGRYDATVFIEELKQMVSDIVVKVKNDTSMRYVSQAPQQTKPSVSKTKKKSTTQMSMGSASSQHQDSRQQSNVVAGFQPKSNRKSSKKTGKTIEKSQSDTNLSSDEWVGLPCPICKIGHIIKGNTAYGCSRWKEGCNYRKLF